MILKVRKIKVNKQSIEALSEKCYCTITAVYNALAYRSNSENAEKIRREALQNFGGKEVTEIKVL